MKITNPDDVAAIVGILGIVALIVTVLVRSRRRRRASWRDAMDKYDARWPWPRE